MNPADHVHKNRVYRAPKPFTKEDAARARDACYRSRKWILNYYKYPIMAELQIISDGQTIPLLSPYIGGQWHSEARKRTRRMDFGEKNVEIYVVIPSMANVPKRGESERRDTSQHPRYLEG